MLMRNLFKATVFAIALVPVGGTYYATPAYAEMVFNRGNSADPESLDPHKTSTVYEANILKDLFEGLVVQDLIDRPEAVSPAWAFVIETLGYAISWAAFPLIAIVATQLLGLSRNYAAMIIAANWAAVIQIGAFLVAVALGFVLPAFAGFVVTLATVAILVYQWFVFRTALNTTGGIAIALVLVDLLVNAAISLTADSLL